MPPKVAQLTYSQRVGAAFVAFIQFYAYLKQDHGVYANTLTKEMREKRADDAIELALTMQRAMLALMGTSRRRTYAHDLVYGTYPTYSTCSSASPGLGAASNLSGGARRRPGCAREATVILRATGKLKLTESPWGL